MKKAKIPKTYFIVSASALAVILIVGLGFFVYLKTGHRISLGSSSPSVASSIITHGLRSKKEVAFTFDADMTPHMVQDLKSGKVKQFYNPNIITVLEQNKVPATIFMTGLWAQMYPQAAKSMAKNPLFEIGNHSYDHAAFETPCYGLQPATDKSGEVTKAQNIIHAITGKTPAYFRFPGGCASPSDAALVRILGLQPVGWDVVSGDPDLKSNASIAEQIVKNAQNGSIIIMHISGVKYVKDTSIALASAIRRLKAKGFVFATVSQLLKAKSQPFDTSPASWSDRCQNHRFVLGYDPCQKNSPAMPWLGDDCDIGHQQQGKRCHNYGSYW